MTAKYYIGTSGWHYDHWKGKFYPYDIPQSEWLLFYSQTFSTVEVNNSFYTLPSEKAFIGWMERSPCEFTFSLKANRFITHVKRLRNVDEAIARFVERAQLLEGKLGCILYQLPANIHRNDSLLEDFLKLLPTELQHVIEFREESWFVDSVVNLLRNYNVGFCIYDGFHIATPMVVTAEFAYIRFHGSGMLYGGCYSDDYLSEWAKRIRELNVNKVYIYFNNDAQGFAVRNASTMKHLLEVE